MIPVTGKSQARLVGATPLAGAASSGAVEFTSSSGEVLRLVSTRE